jgi:hypothetical protein
VNSKDIYDERRAFDDWFLEYAGSQPGVGISIRELEKNATNAAALLARRKEWEVKRATSMAAWSTAVYHRSAK